MTTNVKIKTHGIRITEYGGPEVMKFSEYELPSPAAGEARIKIHAAGLNFIDIYQRRGTYRANIALPYTPGLEASGVVEEIGEGVAVVKVGDRVAYSYGPGSYAQANIVRADSLIPLPAEITFEQGAAFPLQGMTAHYLLHEFHKLKPGETVLIHAAAGGMGGLLVQWAKHMGARVIGTVSNEAKAKIARAAGADEIIIYTEQDFVKESKRLTDGQGPQFIIDGVGKDTFTKDLDAVTKRGHVVLFGAASGPAEPLLPNSLQNRSITVSGGSLFNYLNSREELLARSNDVLKGIKEGWLRLKIEHILPLKDVAKAHEMLESRSTTGKIILQCSD
jgi:NADPH2:quinone reductase